ncbi:MAG: carbohydrate ABC transporter permease [Candidatus Limnocylindria bacterium]
MTAQAPVVNLPRPGRLAGFRRSETLWALVFLSPWIAGFVIFTAGPMVASFLLSFTDYSALRPGGPNVVGLDNYIRMAQDPKVVRSLGNTVYYTLLHVPLSMAVALALALILNRVGRSSGFFRTVFYLPAVTPAVAIGILWLWLLNPQVGLVNRGLAVIGIDGPAWTTDTDWIKPGIVLMSLWSLGTTVVIYFAALRNVPQDLYEAARIDGANRAQQFRNVTLPMISGALFFTLVVNTISSLQIFSEVYTMYFGNQEGGASASAALFYVIYLFQQAFKFFHLGYASAMAWLLFIVILAITLFQLRLSKRWVYYEGES